MLKKFIDRIKSKNNNNQKNVKDQLYNPMTASGGFRDNSNYNYWVDIDLSEDQITTIYNNSVVGKKIINIPVDDMFYKGRVAAGEIESFNEIEKYYKENNIYSKVNYFLKSGMLFGTSILFFVTRTKSFMTPLLDSEVENNGLIDILTFKGSDIQSIELGESLTSGRYGQPLYYNIMFPDNIVRTIHYSRLIPFVNNPPVSNKAMTNTITKSSGTPFYGIPLYNLSIKDINAEQTTLNTMEQLVVKSNIYMYKSKAYEELNNTSRFSNSENTLYDRLNDIMMQAGTYRMVGMDAEDEINVLSPNMGGISEANGLLMKRISALSNIPITRFFGTSPSGLNASGASEERAYASYIAQKQEIELRPILNKIDELICISEGIDNVTYSFVSTLETSEKEQAEIREIDSRTVLNLSNGGITDEESALDFINKTTGFKDNPLEIEPASLTETIEEDANELQEKVNNA